MVNGVKGEGGASGDESRQREGSGKAVGRLGAEILRFAQDDGLNFKSTPAGLKTGATVKSKGIGHP